ncbi:MAG: hypothetical protein VX066_04820 [Pseudomonadota bacterium]|nr:hypothetical protein [Pseudomonadota bacterium]
MQSQHHFSLRVPASDKADLASFSIGIPMSQGACFVHKPLQCKRSDDMAVDCAFTPLAWWPDHSIKWLLVQGHTAVSGISDAQFYIEHMQTPAVTVNQEHVDSSESPTLISLSTRNWQCKIQTDSLLNCDISVAGKHYSLSCQNTFRGVFSHSACQLTHWHVEPKYYDQQDGAPAFINLSLDYTLIPEQTDFAAVELRARLVFQPSTGIVTVTTSLTNTNPAEHNGGTWDLGEQRSLLIDSLAISVSQQNAEASLQVSPEQPFIAISKQALLWQRSSGGENWNSPNHVNHNRTSSIVNGSTLLKVDDSEHASPHRPVPSARLSADDTHVIMRPDRFWQNFPTALTAEPGTISWSLFQSESEAPVELQPGEQKTHSLTIQVESASAVVIAQAMLNPAWISQCDVIPRLSARLLDDPLQSVINAGVEGPDSFFAKREAIDEFGWRHFGDLYADHETAGYSGDTLFTSHYNNQYDPLFGFLKQWLLTGDQRWRELADDLARHVIDIDIYHTDLDKPEYNRGLFWHTDHYLPAETATHRTYSKHHTGNAYQDHAGGGGPGGQHCYTTGLQLYYFLTGCQAAQQAVLGLTEWISTVYEGDDTLFGLLLSYKNRYRIDLKDIASGAYPLDRGTANYMMALLDSYEITNDSQYIQRVAYIIKQTIAPDDDIAGTRDLANVENCWFYTVFLQAVCRYLDIQQHIGKNHDYQYAIACLLHYADWMAENEYPYLEKPDILEYPNQTWSAQDLRKVAVLCIAATYADATRAVSYRAKATEIKQYVVQAITQSDEKHYTRILALLMQNYGIDTVESNTQPNPVDVSAVLSTNIQRDQGWPGYVSHVVKKLSVKREWQQLQKRIPALRRKLQ